MSLSDVIRNALANQPEPKRADEKPPPSSQPSDQARRWDNAVPKKPRCPECGFLLSERRECVMGCAPDVKTWQGDQA